MNLPRSKGQALATGRTALLADPPCFALELLARVDARGATSVPYAMRLADGEVDALAGAFADAVHFLSILHGTHPSFAELAETGAGASCPPVVAEWLMQAAIAFEGDRQWLARLVLAAGPSPFTLGLTQAEQAVRGQRDAMLTLARSDRPACALGAAAALLHDWDQIRPCLAASAARLWEGRAPRRSDDEPPVPRDLTRAAVIAATGTAATRRALQFGAEQLLVIHRTLWDLLEARQAASLP